MRLWFILSAMAFMSSGALAAVVQPGGVLSQIKDTPSSSKLFQKTTIFKDDSRQVIKRGRPAPWSAVGRLANPKNMGCTAFLVGRRIAATNAHCVIDKDTKTMMKGDYRFYPSYRKGHVPYEARVTYIWFGTNDVDKNRGEDWALLVLDWPVGDKVGWFGSRGLSPEELLSIHNQHPVYMAGYSDDNGRSDIPLWERCRFEEYFAEIGVLGHSCSGTNGASGSPIFMIMDESDVASSRVLGMHSAEGRNSEGETVRGVPYSSKYANVAVPSIRWVKKLVELMENAN